MKRHLLALIALSAALACAPTESFAVGGGHGGGGRGINFRQARGGGLGFGSGLGIGGIGGGYSDIFGYAELYRELYNNIPYFALHPPVYYSQPVPRTYGYSPFAYPGSVMTPEIAEPVQPVTIINPHVKSGSDTLAKPATDKAAAVTSEVQPLVVFNPYVAGGQSVAQAK